jgi:hypothetical protein
MAIFSKGGDPAVRRQRDLEAKLKTSVADRDKVADRLRTFEARVTERRDAARALVRDGGDDAKLTAIESEMRAAQDRVATLTGGIADLDKAIADLEHEIAAIVDQRCRAKTAAAINELITNWESATAAFEVAARELETIARETAPIVLDGHGLAAFAMGIRNEVPPAVNAIIVYLKEHAASVLAGHAPASLPVPEEPAPLKAVESPPLQTLFCLRTVKWTDSGGEKHVAQQYEDASLEPHIAARAIRRGACVQLDDPRRKKLLGAHGGKHPRADALDTIDLDEQATRPAHIAPILASDPLASADFTLIDCGPARTIKVAAPRLL